MCPGADALVLMVDALVLRIIPSFTLVAAVQTI